jgi:hypothetical protein
VCVRARGTAARVVHSGCCPVVLHAFHHRRPATCHATAHLMMRLSWHARSNDHLTPSWVKRARQCGANSPLASEMLHPT